MLVALSVLAFVLTGAGCSTTTAPEAQPSDDGCSHVPASPVTVEQAATCVYQGWVTQDEEMVAAYGAAGVTDDLPIVMEGPKLTSEGCAAGSSDDEVVCSWLALSDTGPTTLRIHATGTDADGYRVVAMEFGP